MKMLEKIYMLKMLRTRTICLIKARRKTYVEDLLIQLANWMPQ